MKYFLAGFLVLCLGLFSWGYLYREDVKEFYQDWKKDQAIKDMPNFEFKTLTGFPFNRDSLTQGQKTMLMYFNPLCDHCQEEVEDVKQHKEDFSAIQVVLVSPYLLNEVLKFDSIYGISKEENMIILHDEKYQFYQIFNAKAFPTTYIYNANRRLKEKIRGKISHKDLVEKL